MPAYVASLSATMDDQVSAGAQAAADALGKMADAADGATASVDATATTVTRAGKSASALVNSFDPATKAANALTNAQNALQNASATLSAAVDSGTVSQAQSDAAMASLAERVRVAQAAFDQLTASAGASTTGLSGVTDASSETANALAAAQRYQDALNTSLGVSAQTQDGYEQRAADVAAYGAELDRVRAKFDPVFAASKQYEATLEEISMAERTGAISATVAAAARDATTTSFAKANAVTSDLTDATNTATAAHAGFYREIVIIGHEVVTGNYSRLGGSMMVLAERSGNLESAMSGVKNFVTSVPGVFTLLGVAAVAAFAGIAISTDNQTQRLITMQEQLRATRDDYISLGAEATAAAQGAAQQTPGLSRADALKASGTLAASPQFAGTQQQLQSLIELSADMATVFDTTVDKAAQDLANAMEAPGDAADKLVGKLRGMSQAVADSIKLQADAGDKAGAFARIMDIETQAVQHAADQLTPMRQALRDIETAFNDSGAAGAKSGQGIGSAFQSAATYILEAVAAVLNGIKELHDFTGQYLPWASNYAGGTSTVSGKVTAGQYDDETLYGTAASIGAQNGLSADQLALVRAVILQESGGRQFTDSGNVLRSSAGALGAMQVLPATAAAFGQDPTTETGNLTAGELYLKALWIKYKGDQTLVAAAYNWGPGNVDKWISAGSDPNQMPAETQKYIQNVTGAQAAAVSPAASGNPAGVANTSQGIIDQALQKSSGSQGASMQELQATIKLDQQAEDAMKQTGEVGSAAWNKIDTALQAAVLQYSELRDPQTKALTALANQTDAQDTLSAAYGKGYAAVAQQTAATQAQEAALHTVGIASGDYGNAVAQLQAHYEALADATARAGVAQQTLANGTQIEYLKAETDSLGTNNTARTEMLAHLKAEEDLREKNVSDQSAEGKAYLDSVDAISAATAAYQAQQDALNELQQFAQSSFTSIGNTIAQAFTDGGNAVKDFGNIAHTVITDVLQEIVKLSLINPVMNSLFGGSAPTIDSVTGLMGGGSGLLSGLGRLLGAGGESAPTVTDLGTVDIQSGLYTQVPTLTTSPAGGAAGGGGIGALGGIGLGIGAGTLLNGLAGGNQTGGAVGSAIGAVAGGLIPIPGVGPLIGAALGGLIGGLFGNSKPSDKTEYTKASLLTGASQNLGNQPGSSEYNAQNVQAAANLSAAVYGGEQDITQAFGLKGINEDFESKVGSRDGIFVRFDNGTQFNADNSTAGATQVTNEAMGEIIDRLSSGFSGVADTLLKGIDYSSSDAAQEVKTLAGALTNGQLDATQNIALKNINTANPTQAISDLDWIKNTYEPAVSGAGEGSLASQIDSINKSFEALTATATRLGLSTSALNAAQQQQIADANTAAQETIAASGASIQAAAQKADGDSLGSQLTAFDADGAQQQQQLVSEFKGLFGSSYAANADFVSQMALLTSTLATQRQALVTSYQQQQQQQQVTNADTVWSGYTSNIAAGEKAQATVDSYSTNLSTVQAGQALNEQADLVAFDAQAQAATDAYQQQLINTFGQGFATTSEYANLMVAQEQSLAEQRLAIQAQYAQQAKQEQESAESSASSVINGLTSFASSLALGNSSPLSAQSQYKLAQSQYQAVLAQAQAGDPAALGLLQNDASAFLSASQNLNGSGAQYAADFASVVQALNAVASVSQDALTQQFMQAALQSQTDQLTDALAGLQAAMASIKTELAQANARP